MRTFKAVLDEGKWEYPTPVQDRLLANAFSAVEDFPKELHAYVSYIYASQETVKKFFPKLVGYLESAFDGGPSISIRVEEPTSRPIGVPESFEYEGISYKIVYEVRPIAQAL